MKITQDKLKQLLHYNPYTGIFKWRNKKGKVKRKDVAGSTNNNEYTRIVIDYKFYQAHRLAWLYMYGYFPENDIDHIDRIRNNNRINNLREVSRQCNMRNSGNPRNNNSGVKGVCWYKSRNKWYAQIIINQKLIFLGYYKSFDEAVCYRLAAEQSVNWSGCDSSSPAYQYVQKMLGN